MAEQWDDDDGQARIDRFAARVARQRRAVARQLELAELEDAAAAGLAVGGPPFAERSDGAVVVVGAVASEPLVVEHDPDRWLTRVLHVADARTSV